jgi:phosphohistidine phosphatase SixA
VKRRRIGPAVEPRGLSRWSAVLLLAGWAVAAAQPSGELEGQLLIEALRAGGHTIYFRHAATDWSQQDRVEQAGDWTSCDPARIRQLSAAGRATARAIGVAMRALRIPVDQVLASPYCRTRETAALMELGPVETSEAVINMRVASYFGGRQAVIAAAQALLATPPTPGHNRVVVAHGNVARDATPVYPGEAGAVVFESNGEGGFRVVGRLAPDDWTRLAAEAED